MCCRLLKVDAAVQTPLFPPRMHNLFVRHSHTVDRARARVIS
jgi:hypothetical protein